VASAVPFLGGGPESKSTAYLSLSE